MKFFNENIVQFTLDNDNYRTVLFTTKSSQLVLMSIPAGLKIPQEVHQADQIFMIVDGCAEATVNSDNTIILSQNSLLIVPAGTKHMIKNCGTSTLRFFTIYTPPVHSPGEVERTQDDENN
jgi:mannose-6-phosphate isomerase-like protein (cupin superfamily)